ncbi:MAG: hypothetical protein Pars2KO_16570 [Parasphingorhabdus sp.]
MFHVIYKWSVPSENKTAFLTNWEKTTNHIHDTVDGALGSFCVEAIDDPNMLLTIAKWQTREQWETFIGNAKTGSMKNMHALAEQVSAEGFNELGDQTKSADT